MLPIILRYVAVDGNAMKNYLDGFHDDNHHNYWYSFQIHICIIYISSFISSVCLWSVVRRITEFQK